MPLTNQQIETLFAFTKKKSVQYYDLQVELVDHLASSIGEEMEKDANLSFDAALQKVYGRFGLFGFAHVVQERERALEKQGWKLFWKMLRSHFSIPRITFTISLFATAYIVAPLLTIMVQHIVIILAFVYLTFIRIQSLRQRRKTDVKPLLLAQCGNFFTPLPLWVGWGFPVLFSKDNVSVHPIAFAGVLTLLIVLHLTAIHIDKQIRRKAKELYPEAFSIA